MICLDYCSQLTKMNKDKKLIEDDNREHTTMRKACGSSSRSISASRRISGGRSSWFQMKTERFPQAFSIRS